MTEVLITAARVVIGPADRVLPDGAVLVRGGSIAEVGRSVDLEAATDARVPRMSCPDATVLPGLIDSHVHLAFDAGPNPIATAAHTDPDKLIDAMADRARAFIAAGVTTVRDLGDRAALTVALRNSEAAGTLPRIVAATTPLTSPGGHCGVLGGEVSGAHQIRAQIAKNAAAGADLIKVMASGGALTPGGPPMWEAQFTPSELRLIVDEATVRGLPVAAHVHGTATIADCVNVGARTLEHCSWRTEQGIEFDPRIAQQIADRGIDVCRCVSGDWRLFLEQLGAERADALTDSIRAMRKSGVRFIAGTDAGVPGADFGDYVGMLEFFVSLGFTNAEALDMATVNAAAALGLTDTGTLARGKRADLIVVEGNALSEISALRRVRHVVLAGRQVF
jgi:imidazolonepropionase-like amidohydrolase